MAAAIGAAPRIRSVHREVDYTLGHSAIALAERAGYVLDPWQVEAVLDMLAVRPDGRWAHFEFGLNVCRQNGKGTVLEVRELALLFGLTAERLGVHSAHEFATTLEHFRRLEDVIRNCPELHAQVRRKDSGQVIGYRHSHGEESIEVVTDGVLRRLMFKTRTKSGLRGFAGVDYMSLDEAMILAAPSHGAMMPTLRASSAPRGPQLVYTGSAVDEEVHERGLVWTRVRERGMAGEDPSLGYVEYSVEGEHPDDISDERAASHEAWAQANPSLGIRIPVEQMANEYRSMDPRTFAVELLGVGAWPSTADGPDVLISPEQWAEVLDEQGVLADPICLAFDVSPERHSTICAAGLSVKGPHMVEVVHSRPGTGWLAERLVRLYEKHTVLELVCDGYGPAAAIARKVEDARIPVRRLDAGEYGVACGAFVDAVGEGNVRHLGQQELDHAIRGAKARPLVDRWAWSRSKSTVNISPLVAATLALHSAMSRHIGRRLVIY